MSAGQAAWSRETSMERHDRARPRGRGLRRCLRELEVGEPGERGPDCVGFRLVLGGPARVVVTRSPTRSWSRCSSGSRRASRGARISHVTIPERWSASSRKATLPTTLRTRRSRAPAHESVAASGEARSSRASSRRLFVGRITMRVNGMTAPSTRPETSTAWSLPGIRPRRRPGSPPSRVTPHARAPIARTGRPWPPRRRIRGARDARPGGMVAPAEESGDRSATISSITG